MLEAVIIMFVLVLITSTMATIELRRSSTYKQRWLKVSRLLDSGVLDGDEKPQPPKKPLSGPWRLEMRNGKADSVGGEYIRTDAIFFEAVRDKPYHNKVRLDAFWATPTMRGDGIPTPTLVLKTQKRCYEVVRQMNEQEHVHKG